MNNERSLAKEITEGFEALKSMRNNEPVAYFVKNKHGWWAETDKETGIPLYTHPVEEQEESFDRTASHMAGEYVSYQKELTDEEIKQIFIEESGFDLDTCSIAIMDFARAILRKASEK